MIKYVLQTVSSITDRNGNRYHYSTVTRTDNGRSITKLTNSESEMAIRLKRLGIHHEEVLDTRISVPKGQFRESARSLQSLRNDSELTEFLKEEETP